MCRFYGQVIFCSQVAYYNKLQFSKCIYFDNNMRSEKTNQTVIHALLYDLEQFYAVIFLNVY